MTYFSKEKGHFRPLLPYLKERLYECKEYEHIPEDCPGVILGIRGFGMSYLDTVCTCPCHDWCECPAHLFIRETWADVERMSDEQDNPIGDSK